MDKERFERADQNKDGNLDRVEYNHFLHPYNYEHMQDLELKEIMMDYDKDRDGVVSFDEFIKNEEGKTGFINAK